MATRKEAKEKGYQIKPTRPNANRRADFHDYSLPGFYLITLATLNRMQCLGSIVMEQEPYIALSKLGQTIRDEEFPKISRVYPQVSIHSACIMPDHIHMILDVATPFPEGKTLGTLVNGFKTGCRHAYRQIFGIKESGLFEEGYNDRILMNEGQLRKWRDYIKDNPRRLALKRSNSGLFTPISTEVCGIKCMLMGNRFLLDNPDIMPVVFHRKYSQAEWMQLCDRWLECASSGGVLAGAFINPNEKAVMAAAIENGGRIIKIECNGFAPLFKPAGIQFDACAEGRLLLMAPPAHNPFRKKPSRAACLQLNAIAELIASSSQANKLP